MEITSGSAVLAAESVGEGPDVLLVHAGVTDQRGWAPVLERLPGSRCLTYDARGYGRTTYRPEDGWSGADDALAVLDGYDVGRAVVVGASMGAKTSIDLTLEHPDRVRALVLIGPAISGAPEATYEPEVLALDEEWETGGGARRPRDDQPAGGQGLARRPDRPGGARVRCDPRAVPRHERSRPRRGRPGGAARRVAAWDRLAEIAVPTLLLVGDLDLRYIKEGVAHAAATIPGARLVELPGVAHLPHLEGDERTLREIADFVASV